MCVRVDNPPKFGRRLCEKILCICHHRRTSSEVACKKKLAHEFGLPHFLLLNQTHEVWFSFYAIPSLLFWIPLRLISHEKDNT